jgi:hypothetical protein
LCCAATKDEGSVSSGIAMRSAAKRASIGVTARAMRDAAPGEAASETFARAQARLRAEMPFQNPVLAGDAAPRRTPFLGGRESSRAAHAVFAVERVRNGDVAVISGGWAHGITVGSELRVVASGAPSPWRSAPVPLPASGERGERGRLEPLLRWRTEIVRLKTLPKGHAIGYGTTFHTARESRIATLPVGYADGYSRLLSNNADVLIRGQRAPVVGRVSMDLVTIDVTDIADANVGDEVILLGDEIPVEEHAARTGTIAYEVFCRISARVPRVYER